MALPHALARETLLTLSLFARFETDIDPPADTALAGTRQRPADPQHQHVSGGAALGSAQVTDRLLCQSLPPAHSNKHRAAHFR